MKKVLALVLALTMVLGSFGTVFAASYSDVEGTYEDAISRLSTLGILTGYKDGTFKPENEITRAEFAAVAMRAKGLEAAATAAKGLPTGFTDVNTAHWASGYVGTAARLSIVNGVGNGQFAPESPVKYEEAITMLVRALGYEASAAAKGGYPYGYLVVANEIGLLDAVKGTQGTAATRGAVAQMTDNALEIPMMVQVGFGSESKWVVSGTKEHGGSERYLLDDLGFDSVEGRVVSINTRAKKITVDPTDEDLRNVTLDVKEGFDYYAVEGAVSKFWSKDDVVEVYVVQEAPVFDAVEVDKDELTLVVADENYEVAKGATLTLDGKKVDQDEFNADYAKIAINDDDEIIWAEGYTLDGFVLVEEVKDNVAYSYDEYDEVNVKDFLVVKDGKTIGIDGIAEEDILLYNAEEDFAVVYNKGTEGELDRVYTNNTFRFEGAAYSYTDIAAAIYFDEGKVGELNSDILDDFLDEEATITVYVDFAGKAVVVAGEVSSVGNSAYGVLTSDVNEYQGRRGSMVALDIRNGANEKVSYDILSADLGSDIKLHGAITSTSFTNEELEAGTVLKIATDKDGDVTSIELPESVELRESFDLDDSNAKGVDGYSYKLQSNTIVFHDSNKKATTLGNAKDAFKEVKSGGTLYIEKGRVVAVVGETNADADTKNVTGLVTNVKEVPNGKLEFTVKVFGTTQRLLTESKSLKLSDYSNFKNKIKTFEVGETSGEIKGFPAVSSRTLTIESISGRVINPTTGSSVELNTNAVIYDADLDTMQLRNLKKNDVVTVYFQGSSNRFVDYVTVGTGSTAPTTRTGIVTNVVTAPLNEASFTVDDSTPYFVNTRTVLRDKNNAVIATGVTNVIAGLTIGDQVTVTVDGDVMTIKILATAGDIDLEEALEDLADVIAEADAKVQANYTTASWATFSSDLVTAKALPQTTLTQVNTKIAAVNTAISQLVELGVGSIDITGATNIDVPSTGATETETYVAVVKNQDGTVMTGELVTWSLQAPVAGVSIHAMTGVVTVTDAATTGNTFVVVATSVTNPIVTGNTTTITLN